VFSSLYAWAAEHPLSRRFSRSPLSAKVTKYAIGSAVALTTSVIVFGVMDWLGIRTGIDSAAAFIAGAIPNWILNRKWAWKMEGRAEFVREILAYTAISVLVWAASTWMTGHTQNWAKDHIAPGNGLRVIITTAAYVFVQAVFFGVKFVIYDKWVFAGRSRIRAALRSRHHLLRKRAPNQSRSFESHGPRQLSSPADRIRPEQMVSRRSG
jgi:putative flippase GtrA